MQFRPPQRVGWHKTAVVWAGLYTDVNQWGVVPSHWVTNLPHCLSPFLLFLSPCLLHHPLPLKLLTHLLLLSLSLLLLKLGERGGNKLWVQGLSNIIILSWFGTMFITDIHQECVMQVVYCQLCKNTCHQHMKCHLYSMWCWFPCSLHIHSTLTAHSCLPEQRLKALVLCSKGLLKVILLLQ